MFQQKIILPKRGDVTAKEVWLDEKIIEKLNKRYIAFDVETTGLNAHSDRIIEVGAVLFENGQPTQKFGSLVHSVTEVPYSVTVINLITTDMVRAAPSERTVYDKLTAFLGDALNGETLICAYNARFDMSFLSETFERLGYDAKITYVDTLAFARYVIRCLKSYRQSAVASYLNIDNEQEHRADSDAKVCGMILSELLSIQN